MLAHYYKSAEHAPIDRRPVLSYSCMLLCCTTITVADGIEVLQLSILPPVLEIITADNRQHSREKRSSQSSFEELKQYFYYF